MDTAFWGPPGHELFHSLTLAFDRLPSSEKDALSPLLIRFFRSVGHVLPCIYCRRSFQKYFKEYPLRDHLDSTFAWYYHIHNLINDKLRKQGYLHSTDPSYDSVLRKYQEREHSKCFVGWDFLYSVIYHFPVSASDLSRRRLDAYVVFFNMLALFYPKPRIREKYVVYLASHPVEKSMFGGHEFMRWLYRFERFVNKRCCSFEKRRSKLEKYRVKTCANQSCRRTVRHSRSKK